MTCFPITSLVWSDPQLEGSVKERRMYLFHCDFSSCLESTENWYADSFCVKKRPLFIPQAGKQGFKHVLESPPPLPPSPSNSVKHTRTVFWLSRIEILRCLETGRERGGFSCNFVHTWLPSRRKNHRDSFLTQKESACQISVDSEQLEKSQQNHMPPFYGALQLITWDV